ncbi:TonB-dependent hemoglobin/transferrin/lactoferrin family receptor [Photobacterium sanguinicancri]|uniref:Ligand-gated channel n=1 Tax=Photobacterium sanguinicancri TaxID=875932 RepID=A0ABX4FYI8_9GAMM|nr:TonB-dependent hemoglobin/transferrin/lactoferrin family receptor [Photobacterium sanguinicancri]OZS43947.1 ligand-gated channel [Photobacterium sanguinicancri]
MKLHPIAFAVLSGLASHAYASDLATNSVADTPVNTTENSNSANTTQMETIIVTATKIEQPLSKTSGSVSVITSDQIKRAGATELYDALNHEPGVSVTGGAGRPQNITIRGMTGNRIAIIKNGVKVGDGYGAADLNDVTGRNSFDLSNVKQIEVIKGAGSSLYGSGAIGGVVVVTTKQPGDYLGTKDSHYEASASYAGISDKQKLSTTIAQRFGDHESLLLLSGWQGGETHNYNRDLYDRELEGYSTEFTHNYFLNDLVMLKGTVSYYKETMERNDGMAPVQEDGRWKAKQYYENGQTTSFDAQVGTEIDSLDNSLFDRADIKAYYREKTSDTYKDVFMQREHQSITEKRRQVEQRLYKDSLIGLSADQTKAFQLSDNTEHQVAWGVQFEQNKYQRPINKNIYDWRGTTGLTKDSFADATMLTAAVFIRDQIKWQEWTITPGVRYDRQQLSPTGDANIGGIQINENNSSEISPSLSVAYQFTPALNSYLSYSHGFRAPAYDKTYGYVPHLFNPLKPFIIIPNSELKQETSDNFELGSKYDDGRFSLYAAVFYSKFKNFIEQKMIGQAADKTHWQFQYQNLEGVKTYGFELSSAYQLTDAFKLSGKLGLVDGKDGNGEPIRTLTPLEGNIQLDYTVEKITAFSRLNFAAAMPMDRTPKCYNNVEMEIPCATTDNWATLDLGASYQVSDNFTLYATVINAFNNEYIRYQDVAGIGENSKSYSTEPGRYFNINANYQF